MVAAAVVGGMVASAAISGTMSSKAAKKASGAQVASSQEAEAGVQARFEQIQELLKPYVESGNQSLSAQKDLVGLNGNGAQQASIDQLTASPQFTSMAQQGETGILQNAAATGGVRGGDTQSLLAQYRPQLLSQLINDQYNKLGGITQTGLGAATGTGNASLQTGNTIAQLTQDRGAALAGGYLAQGKGNAAPFNAMTQIGAMYLGNKGF